MGNAYPTVVALTGEWDIYRRDELRKIFTACYDDADVIFDLSAITYADSTVLSELVEMRKHRLTKDLPMFAVVPSKMLERVLEITHLNQFWPCFSTLDAAVASFDAGVRTRCALR
jgi:anti-anti-sigma factor